MGEISTAKYRRIVSNATKAFQILWFTDKNLGQLLSQSRLFLKKNWVILTKIWSY